MTDVHVAVFKGCTITLIILVLCLSYPHARKSNLENFFPYHDSGVFAGAAVVSSSLLPMSMTSLHDGDAPGWCSCLFRSGRGKGPARSHIAE